MWTLPGLALRSDRSVFTVPVNEDTSAATRIHCLSTNRWCPPVRLDSRVILFSGTS